MKAALSPSVDSTDREVDRSREEGARPLASTTTARGVEEARFPAPTSTVGRSTLANNNLATLEDQLEESMLSPEEQRLFDRDPERFLRDNAEIARAFNELAMEKLLEIPQVQELLTTQFRVMLADPKALRKAKQAAAERLAEDDDSGRGLNFKRKKR